MTTLHLSVQDIPGLGKKNVLAINGAEPDNGVPCLKLFVPGMKAIIVHYDNTPAVKKLAAVGVTLDGRFFKLDGERVATQMKVDWLIKYSFTPEGLVNIANVEKNPMATKKQNPKSLPPAPSGAFDGSKPTRGEVELVERVARHEADVKALETAKMGLELAYSYPADDPDGIWARILKERGAGSIDELVDMKSYESQRVITGYESDLEAWKSRKTLPAPSPVPTPAAKSEESEKLNDWFPRDPGTPHPDEPPAHWIDISAERKLFFVHFKEACALHRESAMWDEKKRLQFIHNALDVEHIEQTKHSREEAEKIVIDNLNGIYSSKSENVTENAPISNKNGGTSPVDETKQVSQPANEKSPETPEKRAPVNEGKNHMTEAPFSANFKLINPQGIDIQFTVRDETVNDGVKKVNDLIKILLSQGYTARGAAAPAANGNGNGNGQPAQPSADGGVVGCAMIALGAAYENGNPQLNFECDGFDHPIRFTRPVGEMVKLLGKVKQANGQPFTANDLTEGRKFGGAWRVKWAPAKNPKYKDVLEVLPA